VSVSRDEVRRVAGLARIRLDDEEAAALARDLTGILEHVEELRSAPVEEGDAAADPLALEPKARAGDGEPDALERPPSELAPSWRDGFFVLPRLPALDREPRAREEDG